MTEVKIKISGESSGFQRAVKESQSALSRLSKDLGAAQALAAKALSFAGIGGAASLTGLVTIAKQAADTADSFGKMAQRTGESTEALSRLAYAVSLNDATTEDLEKGLASLSKRIQEGSEAFSALGISAIRSDGQLKSSGDVFHEIADRFAALPDGVQKTNLAVALFGEEVGRRLIPTLNNGSAGLKQMADESDRFGKTITQAMTERAAEFNDNLTRLQALAGGAGHQIGLALVPALNDLAMAFLQALEDERNLTGQNGLQEWADGGARSVGFLVDGLDGFWRVVQTIGKGIAGYSAMAVAAIQGDFAGAKRIYAELDKDIEALLQKPFFSDRLAAQMSPERRAEQAAQDAAGRRRKLEQQLTAAIDRENRLRLLSAGEASGELVQDDNARTAAHRKNIADRRQDELKLYKDITEAAKRAGEEVDALQRKADAALSSRKQEAAGRMARPQQETERSGLYGFAFEDNLMREARTYATYAQNAAIDGRARETQKYAEKALELAKEAAEVADSLGDNDVAARRLETIGEIEKQAIEAEATLAKKKQADFDQQAAAQIEKIREIDAEMGKIRRVQIEADVSQAAAEVARLKAELEKITDKTVTVTVNTVAAGSAGPVPQFAFGGYTGAGGKFEPAGIVHAGEFVTRQEVVRRPGVRAMLEQLNRTGRLPGYAAGGIVSNLRMPPQPAVRESGAKGSDLHLHWPDGSSTRVPTSSDIAREVDRRFAKAVLSAGSRR